MAAVQAWRAPGEDAGTYPDIDLVLPKGATGYFHRDGAPYDAKPLTPKV